MAKKPWYISDPAQYAQIKRRIEDAYPELHFVESDEEPIIAGSYPIIENGKVYDRYQVKIALPQESARGLPTVWEVGGRIPRIRDRHINPSDGTACIVLPDAFWHEHPDGMDLLDFTNGPMRGFFATQSLVEVGDSWPRGEWDHGGAGIVQFYSGLLATGDAKIVADFLNVLRSAVVKGHWSCPCGSGKKLRDCHRDFINQLRSRMPRHVAEFSYHKVIEVLPPDHPYRRCLRS